MKKDVIKYKDFVGSVQFSAEDEVFYGKIEGIDDLVTFEGKSVDELKRAFREAIADYIELCKETGRELHKSYRGSFNIRIKPEIHRKAVQRSTQLGISLNQLVEKAITNILEEPDPESEY